MTSRWSRKRKINAEYSQCMDFITAENVNDVSGAEVDRSDVDTSIIQFEGQRKFQLHNLIPACSSFDDGDFENVDNDNELNLAYVSGESGLTDTEYIYSTSEYDTDDSESDDESVTDRHDVADQCEHLKSQLSNWAVQSNITHRALSRLLLILQPYFKDLPKDARTLLKTTKKVDVKSVAGGQYHHIGIQKGIASCLSQRGCNTDVAVKIQVNVDGLPIFKSSNTQLWPILGRIHNTSELFGTSFSDSPFVIGIYEGKHKPSSAAEYLEEFVKEANALENAGIVHSNNCAHKFKISAFICDMPARSFIKCVKGHGAYSGCDRCIQPGVYHNKVTYPDCHAPLRTDQTFREMTDHAHHIQPSPLINNAVGMISDFPLDYMHLVCLGVVRKLISLWLAGPLRCRLGPLARREISEKLMSLAPNMPCDFARKPRAVSEFERWKATEFRTFLLYTGPVCLLDSLPEEMYSNFILLCAAMTCLLSPVLCYEYADYSRELLMLFVGHFGALYGDDKITYNVHGLIHLPEDAKRYGALDTVSCFPFENCLGMMKRLVRKRSSTLQQIINRLHEKEALKCEVEQEDKEELDLQQLHFSGPIAGEINVTKQYHQMTIGDFQVVVNGRDNYLKLVNGDIVACENIVLDIQKGVWLIYRAYQNCSSFFSYPLPSEKIGIVKCGLLGKKLQYCSVSDVQSKCFILPYKSWSVAFPILHTAA